MQSNKKSAIKILGFDPGSHRLGYGLILKKFGNNIKLLKHGLIDIHNDDQKTRLCLLDKKIKNLIDDNQPDLIGVEKLYFSRNQKTAMDVAEARGIILLAAGQRNIPIKEYSPSTVKQRIAGSGRADKKSVFRMIQFFLGLKDFNCADDVSDAIAVAITAATEIDSMTV